MPNQFTVKQRAIIPIAAFTAAGDLGKLPAALREGLDAGLSVNEIKEILVQLYAYAGFPRSLNAIGTFMTIIDERQEKGIIDETGRESSPLPTGKTSLELGAANQTKLVGQPVAGPLYDFTPTIDQFLKSHLFGDIFGRDVLDWRERELATVAALANMTGVENQLLAHYAISMHNGLSAEQLRELVDILQAECGTKAAANALAVLAQVLQTSQGNKIAKKIDQQADDSADTFGGYIFPRGEKNGAYARYFTGASYLNLLAKERLVIANVTFEPGCRNFWHIHHKGGQILLVTAGRGWYQEWGQPARELSPGDVVNIPPETKHWHGAVKDSWFSHVAIEVPAEGSSNEWLEPVSDEAYNRLGNNA